jgi:hypothetical protein
LPNPQTHQFPPPIPLIPPIPLSYTVSWAACASWAVREDEDENEDEGEDEDEDEVHCGGCIHHFTSTINLGSSLISIDLLHQLIQSIDIIDVHLISFKTSLFLPSPSVSPSLLILSFPSFLLSFFSSEANRVRESINQSLTNH